MASHRGKKVGVWLSVLVVLVPLALQGAGVAWAWHTFGGHPLFWILAALLLAAALVLIGVAWSRGVPFNPKTSAGTSPRASKPWWAVS